MENPNSRDWQLCCAQVHKEVFPRHRRRSEAEHHSPNAGLPYAPVTDKSTHAGHRRVAVGVATFVWAATSPFYRRRAMGHAGLGSVTGFLLRRPGVPPGCGKSCGIGRAHGVCGKRWANALGGWPQIGNVGAVLAGPLGLEVGTDGPLDRLCGGTWQLQEHRDAAVRMGTLVCAVPRDGLATFHEIGNGDLAPPAGPFRVLKRPV